MTPHDHAKTLGIIYTLVGVLLSVPPFGFLVWALLVSDRRFEHALNFPKWSGFGLLSALGDLLLLLLTLSVALVGVGFLGRRRWARVPALVFSVPAAVFFPLGTGLAVYTWWFLHSDGGRRLFSRTIR